MHLDVCILILFKLGVIIDTKWNSTFLHYCNWPSFMATGIQESKIFCISFLSKLWIKLDGMWCVVSLMSLILILSCVQGCQSSTFRQNSAFFFFFLLSTFLKIIFRGFEKSQKKNKKKNFSFTNTATIDCLKSFGKQSVTSWFAGMRFFRFRSKFDSAVSSLSIRNLMLAAMLRVGVQRALPQRGEGEGDGLSNSSICTPSFSTLITLHTHTLSLSLSHTHAHTHTHTHTASC